MNVAKNLIKTSVELAAGAILVGTLACSSEAMQEEESNTSEAPAALLASQTIRVWVEDGDNNGSPLSGVYVAARWLGGNSAAGTTSALGYADLDVTAETSLQNDGGIRAIGAYARTGYYISAIRVGAFNNTCINVKPTTSQANYSNLDARGYEMDTSFQSVNMGDGSVARCRGVLLTIKKKPAAYAGVTTDLFEPGPTGNGGEITWYPSKTSAIPGALPATDTISQKGTAINATLELSRTYGGLPVNLFVTRKNADGSWPLADDNHELLSTKNGNTAIDIGMQFAAVIRGITTQYGPNSGFAINQIAGAPNGNIYNSTTTTYSGQWGFKVPWKSPCGTDCSQVVAPGANPLYVPLFSDTMSLPGIPSWAAESPIFRMVGARVFDAYNDVFMNLVTPPNGTKIPEVDYKMYLRGHDDYSWTDSLDNVQKRYLCFRTNRQVAVNSNLKVYVVLADKSVYYWKPQSIDAATAPGSAQNGVGWPAVGSAACQNSTCNSTSDGTDSGQRCTCFMPRIKAIIADYGDYQAPGQEMVMLIRAGSTDSQLSTFDDVDNADDRLKGSFLGAISTILGGGEGGNGTVAFFPYAYRYDSGDVTYSDDAAQNTLTKNAIHKDRFKVTFGNRVQIRSYLGDNAGVAFMYDSNAQPLVAGQ